MQFRVPQNIDMQDRILGPMTLFQLLFLLLGFLIVFGIYRTGSVVLFVLLGIPIAVLTLALTFYKIQEQPFHKFLIAFILYLLRPKTRIWHKGGRSPAVTLTKSKQSKKETVGPKKLDRRKLAEIASKLDQS